jgi:hypothetical protein
MNIDRNPRKDVKQLLDALNDRLETQCVLLRDERSCGFDDDKWNGRLLLLAQIRPEFRGLVDADTETFEQENRVFGYLERETGEALAWDEEGYGNERVLPHDVSHYLLDDERLDAVLDAVLTLPVIGYEHRQHLIEAYNAA